MKKMIALFCIILGALVLVLVGCQATRAGYESAPYAVVRADGKFEVRDYPAIMVAETPLTVSDAGSDSGFSRLFRFITGRNDAKQKIAMTTPVFMSGGGSNGTMAFVIPAKLKPGEVPKPSEDSVTVRQLEPTRFAVLRFRGGRNRANEAKSLGRLKAWMEVQDLNPQLPAVYGYFDPPWTPGFLRRNEVMLRIEPER